LIAQNNACHVFANKFNLGNEAFVGRKIVVFCGSLWTWIISSPEMVYLNTYPVFEHGTGFAGRTSFRLFTFTLKICTLQTVFLVRLSNDYENHFQSCKS
jgi:hypothetical protein